MIDDYNKIKPHPAAEIFPMMSKAEIHALATDIVMHGMYKPIILHEDMILDGRNRYCACKEAGVDAEFKEFDGFVTPVEYVISMNLHRKHLNESQLAMIAEQLSKLT